MAVNRTYESAPPPEGEYEEIHLEAPTSEGDYKHTYDQPVTGDHVTKDPDHEYANIRRRERRNPCRPVSRKALTVVCVVSVVVVSAAVGAAVWFISRVPGPDDSYNSTIDDSNSRTTDPETMTIPVHGNRITSSPDTNECESGPCLNGGTCEDRVSAYTCECAAGYSGTECQDENIRCASQPCLQGGTCQEGVSGYTCQCPPGYGGSHCQGSQVAFTAYTFLTQTSFLTSWVRKHYSVSWEPLGGAYHYQNSTFYTPSSGVYYVAMSAGTSSYFGYRLVMAPHSLGLSTTSTITVLRSLGRAVVLEIASQSEISIQFTGTLRCCEGTSWSMFSVTAAFHPLVAFTVARTTPTTEPGKVPFTESLLNSGGGYRPADSHFVAPYNGSYYFEVSAGVAAGQTARLHIVKNDVRQVELLNTDTTHEWPEMTSSAAIVKLSRGDQVHVELVEGSVYSGPEFRETSFSGFLCSPLHGQAIAWSLWRTDSWAYNGTSLNPVPFDKVLLNEGVVYSTSQHVVTVPVAGVYCVHIVAGVQRGRKTNVNLSHGRSISGGGYHAANIYLSDTSRNGETTVSQSVLITVEAGNQVWVWVDRWEADGLYSNPGLVTGFSGFLVYPT